MEPDLAFNSLRNLCVLGGSAVKEFAKPNNFSQKPSSLFVDSVTYNSLNRRAAENAEVAQSVESNLMLQCGCGSAALCSRRLCG